MTGISEFDWKFIIGNGDFERWIASLMGKGEDVSLWTWQFTLKALTFTPDNNTGRVSYSLEPRELSSHEKSLFAEAELARQSRVVDHIHERTEHDSGSMN